MNKWAWKSSISYQFDGFSFDVISKLSTIFRKNRMIPRISRPSSFEWLVGVLRILGFSRFWPEVLCLFRYHFDPIYYDRLDLFWVDSADLFAPRIPNVWRVNGQNYFPFVQLPRYFSRIKFIEGCFPIHHNRAHCALNEILPFFGGPNLFSVWIVNF